jgi:uncharacterized protein (TIGR00297 family)
LRFLSWWQAATCAAVAVALISAIRFRRARHGHPARPGRAEIFRRVVPLSGAAAIALLLVLFDRLDIVAAAWGVFTVGVSSASLASAAGHTLPWNRERTFAGAAALALAGGAAGAFLAWWCRPQVVPPPYVWYSIGAPFVAALAAAAVETIPVRMDPRLSVPFTAAAVLWALSLVSEDLAISALESLPSTLPLAVAINAVAALTGYGVRTVSRSGAIAGAAIGVCVLVTTGWSGWTLLVVTFASAALTTRIGLRRKTRLAIAEPRGGRRSAGNAIANTGVAAAAATLSALTYATGPARIAFVAALTAAGADTIASEIGKARAGQTVLVTRWQLVPPGTPGAVSLAGTIAGATGAVALAALGAALGLVDAVTILPIAGAATTAFFAESVLAATLEPRGFLNNDLLNFFNCAIAVVVALWLATRL